MSLWDLNKLYKSVSRSSKDGSDNLFSYLKFEFVRWLEKTEISGNMLLKYWPISLQQKLLCKNWKRFLYIGLFWEKPLLVLWDTFSFSRDLHFKNMCQTGKFWDPKIRAHRWIRFSQSMTPVGKLREVIGLWHVTHKILRPFLKMIFQTLKIIIWKWWLNLVKTHNFFAFGG